MTVSELSNRLKWLPQDMKVSAFDYGDSQAYEVTKVILQKPDDPDCEDYTLDYESVCLR